MTPIENFGRCRLNYVGIDPGLTGALAILREGEPPQVWDTPTAIIGSRRKVKPVHSPASMVELLCTAGDDCFVVMENVHSMPKQGVASSFNFGRGFGTWEGIIAALGLSYELVTPQLWKKVMMGGMGKEKDASRIRAMQLFPELGEKLKLKKHHGRADALLIASFGRRLHKGEKNEL